MHVEDLRRLPKEFDFISHINPFGIVYHAKEEKHGYTVTCDGHRYAFSKRDLRGKFLNDEYELIERNDNMKEQIRDLTEIDRILREDDTVRIIDLVGTPGDGIITYLQENYPSHVSMVIASAGLCAPHAVACDMHHHIRKLQGEHPDELCLAIYDICGMTDDAFLKSLREIEHETQFDNVVVVFVTKS